MHLLLYPLRFAPNLNLLDGRCSSVTFFFFSLGAKPQLSLRSQLSASIQGGFPKNKLFYKPAATSLLHGSIPHSCGCL